MIIINMTNSLSIPYSLRNLCKKTKKRLRNPYSQHDEYIYIQREKGLERLTENARHKICCGSKTLVQTTSNISHLVVNLSWWCSNDQITYRISSKFNVCKRAHYMHFLVCYNDTCTCCIFNRKSCFSIYCKTKDRLMHNILIRDKKNMRTLSSNATNSS